LQHYGRVSDARKAEIFSAFGVLENWTAEEMHLMLRYHEHELHPGSPEFVQAERLVNQYRQRRGSTVPA
jgi:hypothetical protein